MKIKLKLMAFALMASMLCLNAAAESEPSIQQRRAQVKLFDQALSSFGASTPQEAIRLWVRGDETRNGVFKYAVACDGLKKRLVDRWGAPEDSYWNIGVSSPWLAKYAIVSLVKKNPSKYIAKIKYDWATSSGPFNSTTETLTLVAQGRRWCVADTSGNGNY